MIEEKVLKKIQKALALSKNNPSAEESQTALLKAQELMAKHNLSFGDVEIGNKSQNKDVIKGFGTEFTKLQWWMKELAGIIGDNFRCYNYLNCRYGKRRITFMGLKEDVELCTEIYKFAVEAIKTHSKAFLKRYKVSGDRARTNAIKNDYIYGYLSGMREKFKEQVEKNDWGLVLVKDALVVQKYNEMNLEKSEASKIKTAGSNKAHEEGYKDGKNFDHSRKRISS